MFTISKVVFVSGVALGEGYRAVARDITSLNFGGASEAALRNSLVSDLFFGDSNCSIIKGPLSCPAEIHRTTAFSL